MISLNYLFELKVYDKAKFHDNFDHIKVVLDWLYKNRYLSKEGLEVYKLGVDQETVIHDAMLTPPGKKAMEKAYNKWLKTINHKTKPDIKKFEALAK